MKKLTIAIVFGLITLASCKKESTDIHISSVDHYLRSKAPQMQHFTLDASLGGTLYAQNGSEITIPANSLMDKQGNGITGQVDIEFMEIFSKADMIYSNILPASFSYPLESGGEYFIAAKQNSKDLRVKEGENITIVLPAQAPDDNMQFFIGDSIDDVDSIPIVNDVVNWVPMQSTSFAFSSADNSYSITVDTLGWGNIDRFLGSVSYFDCTFNLISDGDFDNDNTTAFAVFKGQNTVWPMGTGWGSIINNVIFETHLADVPMNIIVISTVNGQLHSGILDITPVNGVAYDIHIFATTPDDLDALITSLP